MAYLFVYIDNIIISRSDKIEVGNIIQRLAKEFPMRDLGNLKFFLGIQVMHTAEGLHLSQIQYLENLLCSCEMHNLKPAITPMVANLNLHSEEESITEVKEYHCIIGSLQYVTLT